MRFGVCTGFFCGFLIIPLVLAFIGCSSSEELFGPEIAFTDGSGGDNFKLTITTDYTGTCPLSGVEFDLPVASYVFFEVTNATGYHVRTLWDGEMVAGTHTLLWDGTNDDGEELGNAIYLYHLDAERFSMWMPFPWGITPDE
ncbi:MAG: FlgD immunoglobulin-like domain containing protein [Candidatus Zixiibacteriota bacterium]